MNSIADAQAKIDAVKDAAKKSELQDKLDAVKKAFEAKKSELERLIETAGNIDMSGMTDTSADRLAQEEIEADQILNKPNLSQDDIETAIIELQAAIDGLRTDKQPLIDVISLHDNQEDYIKNNEDVKKALEDVVNANNESNPSAQDVKDKAKALEEAMQKAIDEETARQLKAEEALELAEKTIEDNKTKKDELPAIDKTAIQDLIDAVLDTEYKKELQARLDAIDDAIEKKREQIAADKKAESERKAAEEIKKQQSLKQPNTGVAKEENSVGIFAAIAVVAISIFAPVVLFAKEKAQQKISKNSLLGGGGFF